MMNVQEMRRIVDHLTDDAVPTFVQATARKWSDDIETLTYIRSSANHIFRFEISAKPFYLRLSPTSERLLQSIQYELNFVLYLAKQGLAVAKPVPSKAGHLLEILDEGYYAVVFEGLAGKQWLQPDDLDAELSYLWGQTVAQIHTLSQSYNAPTPYDRPHWLHQVYTAYDTLSDEDAVRRTLEEGITWLNTIPIQTDNYGLIHSDIQLDNLVWDSKQLGVIDFDDVMHNWYAADISLALDDIWDDAPQIVEDFIKGYQSVHPIALDLKEFIPRFRRVYEAWEFVKMQRAYRNVDMEAAPAWLVMMYQRHEKWFDRRRKKLQEPFSW